MSNNNDNNWFFKTLAFCVIVFLSGLVIFGGLIPTIGQLSDNISGILVLLFVASIVWAIVFVNKEPDRS